MKKIKENPVYSPDIAPSDFWLFGFIEEKRKEKVMETVVPNETQLIIQTRQILNKIVLLSSFLIAEMNSFYLLKKERLNNNKHLLRELFWFNLT